LCSACAQGVGGSDVLAALASLRGVLADATRRKLAAALVSGEEGAVRRMGALVRARQANDPVPVIIIEPDACFEIGVAPVNLACEAVSCTGSKVDYQWFKDGGPLPRAIRPRLSLFGAGPKDVGTYHCVASCGPHSAPSASAVVSVSASELKKQSQFEGPLLEAAAAEAAGKVEDALALLSKAALAAGEENALGKAEAVIRRAELLVRVGRWPEAFKEATAALGLSPSLSGLARAHAARGAAAMAMGLLAEAESSWETAEILGGVPDAGAQAEACRERLKKFFDARKSSWDAERGPKRPGGAEGAEGDEDDREARWKRAGWGNARDADGFFKGFPGMGSAAGSGAGSGAEGRSGRSGGMPADLAGHLQKLGLPSDGRAGMPGVDAVRKAYRTRALALHPDKPGGSKEAFQDLQRAYEALLNALGQA